MSSDNVIYGLFDLRTGHLRYVGLHVGDIGKRLREHLCLARKGKKLYVYDWIRQLLREDLSPEIDSLEICGSKPELVEAEVWHIAYWRSLGCRLTNLTAGGEGCFGYRHSPEARRKMSAAKTGKSQTQEAKLSRRMTTPEMEFEMCQKYQSGLSCEAIGRHYRFSRTGVTKILVRNSVQIRNAAQQRWISTKAKAV